MPKLVSLFTFQRLFITLAICVFPAADVSGQPTRLEYETQFFVTSATKTQLPFWLPTNQYGIIGREGPASYARLSGLLPLRSIGPFTYRAGADLLGRVSSDPALFFQQLYGDIYLGPFRLRGGRKQETAGGFPSSLSLGSMMVSENALPVTQISLSWPEWVSIPGTREFLSVKGRFAHGRFEGNRVVDRPYLHEKDFYLRLGLDQWGVHGWGGFMHFSTWGGTHRNPAFGKLPSSFSDYIRVVTGQGAASNSVIDGEIINAIGNSVAIYDFGLEIDLPSYKIRANRQFYLEDTVSLAFRNAWDGLWELSIHALEEKRLFQAILYQHVNTKRQGSQQFELDQGDFGTDNYYNHFVFASGWTHRGQTIGLPLILTSPDYEGVVNNIILGHHFGVEGWLADAGTYRLMFTASRNYGARSLLPAGSIDRVENTRFVVPVQQYSLLLELNTHRSERTNVQGFLKMAYDWGDLLPDNNFGFMLGLSYKGML